VYDSSEPKIVVDQMVSIVDKFSTMSGVSPSPSPWANQPPMNKCHVYEVRPRKDKRGVDLISDALVNSVGSSTAGRMHPIS